MSGRDLIKELGLKHLSDKEVKAVEVALNSADRRWSIAYWTVKNRPRRRKRTTLVLGSTFP